MEPELYFEDLVYEHVEIDGCSMRALDAETASLVFNIRYPLEFFSFLDRKLEKLNLFGFDDNIRQLIVDKQGKVYLTLTALYVVAFVAAHNDKYVHLKQLVKPLRRVACNDLISYVSLKIADA